MAEGIVVFGANGSGKSTLDRALSGVLGFRYMDVEDYYFIKSDIPYSISRTKDEVIALMLADIKKHGSFILTGVTGDFGSEIASMYRLAVRLSAPADIRMERIKARAVEKFSDRVLPGGDMYGQEQKFFEFVRNRDLSLIDRWAETLSCPFIALDGTKSTNENVHAIIERYNSISCAST